MSLRAVAVRLAVATLLGAVGVTIFVGLMAWLLGAATAHLDERVLHGLAGHRTPARDQVALHITVLGNTTTLAVLVFWVSLFLWLARRRMAVVTLVVTAIGGRLLNELLKALFDRPRPEIVDWGTHVASSSFPSAHAMSGAIVYGAIAYLAGGRAGGGAAGRRAVACVVAIPLVLAIAASRVYLGVHYPTDVAAGIAAGILWTGILITASRARDA